jgi:hypothetical protein
MTTAIEEMHAELQSAVRKLCRDYQDNYLCELDAPISTNLVLSYLAEHVLGPLRYD